jgi:GDP-L-fucose synthase
VINKKSNIFLAGHKGMVGSAILRKLKEKEFLNILTVSKKELDLTDQRRVSNFFEKQKIQCVILAAAKVGGIVANNTYRSEFLYENLMIQSNVINSSFKKGIKNLIFLGSSCVYPNTLSRPIKETDLLSNYLEPTNEPYAVAKIAGIKLCENYSKQYNLNYKSLMPCNLFGINDNFHLTNSHFLPGIIHKIYLAKKKNKKKLVLLGTGQVKRELMYVDDLADACIFFLNKKTKENLINIGSGYEEKISHFVQKIQSLLKANDIKIIFNMDKKMDGTKRKILDTNIAKKYGWQSNSKFDESLKITYQYFLNHIVN